MVTDYSKLTYVRARGAGYGEVVFPTLMCIM